MNDMLLWSNDRRFGFSLKESLLLKCLKVCSDSDFQETGGILFGYYTPDHDIAIVTSISGPPKDSVRKPRFFERGTQGVQSIINRLWREHKHYYLGEWHFHPGGAPIPSTDDIEQMSNLSKNKKLKCPEPILQIIGGNPNGLWTTNAYVFPKDHKYLPLSTNGQKIGFKKTG